MALAVAAEISAQTRALTIDDLYDPLKRIDFSGGAPSGLTWISDTHYLWPKPAERGSVDWMKVHAATAEKPGMHSAAFSPGFAYFFDRWSDVNTPPQVRVSKADGTVLDFTTETLLKPAGPRPITEAR